MKNSELIQFVISSCDKMLKVYEKQIFKAAGYTIKSTNFESSFKADVKKFIEQSKRQIELTSRRTQAPSHDNTMSCYSAVMP